MERERNNYISYAFIVYVLQVALRVSLMCFLKRMHACMHGSRAFNDDLAIGSTNDMAY